MIFLITVGVAVLLIVMAVRTIEIPRHTHFSIQQQQPTVAEGGHDYFDYMDTASGKNVRVFLGDPMYDLIVASIRK